jgi:hypothetical protein
MSRYGASRSRAARDGMQKRKRIEKEASTADASTNDTGKDIGLSTRGRGNGNTPVAFLN